MIIYIFEEGVSVIITFFANPLYTFLLDEKLNPSMHFMVEVVLKLSRNLNNLQILYFVPL